MAPLSSRIGVAQAVRGLQAPLRLRLRPRVRESGLLERQNPWMGGLIDSFIHYSLGGITAPYLVNKLVAQRCIMDSVA